MRLNIFPLVLILLILAGPKISFAVVPGESLFPGLTGWKLSKKFLNYTPSDLFDYIDGAADGFNSYDFEELVVGEYLKGKHKIKAEIYRHSNPDNGFGIYSSERFPDYHFENIGGQAYTSENILNMVCGRYYVKLFAETNSAEEIESMIILAKLMASRLEPHAVLPGLIDFFPSEGKIEYSEQFINRSFLGYEFLSGAFTAEYKSSDGNYKLFIMDCGDELKAKETLAGYLRFTKQDAGLIETGEFVINDKYNGAIRARWVARYIVGILNAENVESAGKNLVALYNNLVGER